MGFCLPKGAENHDPKTFLNFEGKWNNKRDGNPDVVLADSLDDLESDNQGKNTFLDTAHRFKFYLFTPSSNWKVGMVIKCHGIFMAKMCKAI